MFYASDPAIEADSTSTTDIIQPSPYLPPLTTVGGQYLYHRQRFRYLTNTTMSLRDPPQAPPTFKHTPQSLLDETRAIIERSRKIEDQIVRNVKLEEATFDNVLTKMSRRTRT